MSASRSNEKWGFDYSIEQGWKSGVEDRLLSFVTFLRQNPQSRPPFRPLASPYKEDLVFSLGLFLIFTFLEGDIPPHFDEIVNINVPLLYIHFRYKILCAVDKIII